MSQKTKTVEYVRKETREVIVETCCDVCNQIIKLYPNNKDYFFDITVRYSDANRDSLYEHYHICSEQCLKKHIDKYFKTPPIIDSYEIERSTYINDEWHRNMCSHK